MIKQVIADKKVDPEFIHIGFCYWVSDFDDSNNDDNLYDDDMSCSVSQASNQKVGGETFVTWSATRKFGGKSRLYYLFRTIENIIFDHSRDFFCTNATKFIAGGIKSDVFGPVLTKYIFSKKKDIILQRKH